MPTRKTRLNAKLNKYVKANRLKPIPALTLSGGTLEHLEDAKEFRVWAYPKGGGDDYFQSYASLELAMRAHDQMAQRGDIPEKPLAVIWDKKHRSWREVQIPAKMFKGAKDRVLRQVL